MCLRPEDVGMFLRGDDWKDLKTVGTTADLLNDRDWIRLFIDRGGGRLQWRSKDQLQSSGVTQLYSPFQCGSWSVI